MNFYAYVANNPVAFTDPSGLLRFNITRKVYRGGLPFSGDFYPKVGRMHPDCQRSCSGQWQLQFVVDVSLTFRIGAGCPQFTQRHENLHASVFLADLERVLAPLKEAESRTYGSSEECYREAFRAMRAVNANPNPQLDKDQWVVDVIIPCIWQF